MIHRDIGSANVLLWRQGFQWRAKVSDFGSANFVNSIKTKAPGNPFYGARGTYNQGQVFVTKFFTFM